MFRLLRNLVSVKSGHTYFVSKLLHRSAGEITLNDVIGVRRFPFVGHVYDLQTVTGWMLANGIGVSNCRCSVWPWDDKRFAGDE